MIDFYAFSDEMQKIAMGQPVGGLRNKLFGFGKKLGLVETEADAAKRTVGKIMKSVPTATPGGQPMVAGTTAQAQLNKMKLQRQLDEMKRAKGLL